MQIQPLNYQTQKLKWEKEKVNFTKMLPKRLKCYQIMSEDYYLQKVMFNIYYKEVTNKESLGKAYQRLNDGGQARSS